MAFPTAVNDQITDSVTQKKHRPRTFEEAMQLLGSNWVLAKNSTYDAKRREHSGMCETLRPIVMAAVVEWRL